MQVEFKFDIDDNIVTSFNEEGIIIACLVDDTRAIKYVVRTKYTEQCFREDQLMDSHWYGKKAREREADLAKWMKEHEGDLEDWKKMVKNKK